MRSGEPAVTDNLASRLTPRQNHYRVKEMPYILDYRHVWAKYAAQVYRRNGVCEIFAN